MFLLVTYDVCVASEGGPGRLRAVSKICEMYGHRVQCSVFEMQVDATQQQNLENALRIAIDPAQDSIRMYSLGKNYKNKIVTLGKSDDFDVNGLLIF